MPRAGQVSVVTGGSAGRGLAIACALARAGSVVVLASRSAKRCGQAAERLAAETGRPVLAHACDVTDEDAVTGLPLNDGIDGDPHVRRFLDAEVPMRRWAAPAEIAGAALLLTDPQSAYLTGTVLPVDGGWTSH